MGVKQCTFSTENNYIFPLHNLSQVPTSRHVVLTRNSQRNQFKWFLDFLYYYFTSAHKSKYTISAICGCVSIQYGFCVQNCLSFSHTHNHSPDVTQTSIREIIFETKCLNCGRFLLFWSVAQAVFNNESELASFGDNSSAFFPPGMLFHPLCACFPLFSG